ncbi:26446_t:CDS:2, partial [Dentiscutata erythropus]
MAYVLQLFVGKELNNIFLLCKKTLDLKIIYQQLEISVQAITYLPSRLQSNENITVQKDAISTLVKTLKSSLQQSYVKSVLTDINELTILNTIDNTKDFVKIKEIDTKLGIIHKKIDILVLLVTTRTFEIFKKNLKNDQFSILLKIAQRYLYVSATLVSSEHLFLDVGNNIQQNTQTLIQNWW